MDDQAINVLLIESDADESSIIDRTLSEPSESSAKFTVKSAPRLSTGYRLLAAERFDAVILDLAVAQNVGLEGFRKVLAQSPEIPILILTGLQDENLAALAVREGAQDYLIKGTPECCVIKRMVRHAIERKRLAVELERLRVKAARVPSAEPASTSDAERLKAVEAEIQENLRIVQVKSQFMARISHELRNTLATVKTAVYCLCESSSGALNPRQQRLVDMISRNVDRQVKIIDNILDLARFQSGKLKIDFRAVELQRIIEELTAEFRLKNKSRLLETQLPERLPAVNGDPDLLVQVLRNLLENAFRFAQSKVTITAVAAGREDVSISVTNDGAGIPKDRLDKLFNEFVQLDRPTDGVGYKGTGLGLAICKEIIEGHHGRIWVESGDGKGARFSFNLPALESPASSSVTDGIVVEGAAAPGSPKSDRLRSRSTT
jgi:signal transduction histidine kinase